MARPLNCWHPVAVPISFVSQPYDDDFDLLDFFEVVASDDRLVRMDTVVAWAKSSGVEALRSSVQAFRGRGGHVRVIVGISLGGTSKQALASILELADDAYVFHVPGRTFHPKVYIASGPTAAAVLVGSHNLTGGGVRGNFEAGVLTELDLHDDADSRFFRAASGYVDRLVSDEEVCRRLDASFLEELIGNARYPLADEERPSADTDHVEAPTSASVAEEPLNSPELFGSSDFELRSRSAPGREERPPVTEPAAPPVPIRADSPPENDPVVRRWFKRLPAADAQHLTTSHPSRTMTLVQSRHPIDAGIYFREELFGNAEWVSAETRGAGQPREIALIVCEVRVRGQDLGFYTFEIRHTPGYEAAQANRTTEFVWGELATYLREDDVTGLFASIETTATGSCRLVIADEPTGEFRY